MKEELNEAALEEAAELQEELHCQGVCVCVCVCV